MHGEKRNSKNQVALIFDNIFFYFFDIIFFLKSSMTFQYNYLDSFTLLFACGEWMRWYLQNICKYTLKPAMVWSPL